MFQIFRDFSRILKIFAEGNFARGPCPVRSCPGNLPPTNGPSGPQLIPKNKGELKPTVMQASCNANSGFTNTSFSYRQLDFLSEPVVANEILENEPKSCLIVA